MRIALVNGDIAGLDRQPAAARHRARDFGIPGVHGVLGIHDEIENRRFQLAGIDLDLPEVGAADDFKVDRLT